ncbi:MAG: hypothetical protein HFG43_06560 [Lachnospiraceae bacterium]|jgi:hypothetical protein|nr:hypothetical protein [Lachnospiraceae bacterium]MCI9590234.1 hypothetical protein [Lachnospiraceae bacterium]
MSDLSSMNRERKKQQLRRQMITNYEAERSGRLSGEETAASNPARMNQGDGSEEIKEIKKAHGKTIRRRAVAIGVIFFLLAVIAGGLYYWKNYYRFQNYRVSWEVNLTAGETGIERSNAKYVNFGKNVLKYTKDGASYIDNKGKTVWVQTFEMKTPIAAVNGSFAAVADQQGNSIYIFNEDGYQGTATTLLPITRVTISGKGVVAAALEDSKSSYVSMFKRDGSDLKLTMKSTLSKNGYLMDLSFSPDGTQLICSYAYIQNSALRSRVVIYDYSEEVGANIPNRIVSGNDEHFVDKVVPRVQYLTETESFACTDKGLAFFSSENRANPMLTVQTEEERIESLFYSEKYVGLVTANSAGPEPEKLVVYRSDGTKEFETGVDYAYLSGNIDGDYVILYNDNSCKIYNMRGVEKFSGEVDFQISQITCGALPNQFILIGLQKMMAITLR